MNDTKKSVLVVDDDEDYASQLALQLEAAGFTVAVAAGESSALAMLEELAPDLAVVDLMMEHVDGGFALAYRLKRRQPPIPVIMVTGVAAETGLDFTAASQSEEGWLKVDAMLSKPVRFEQLRREIDRLLPE